MRRLRSQLRVRVIPEDSEAVRDADDDDALARKACPVDPGSPAEKAAAMDPHHHRKRSKLLRAQVRRRPDIEIETILAHVLRGVAAAELLRLHARRRKCLRLPNALPGVRPDLCGLPSTVLDGRKSEGNTAKLRDGTVLNRNSGSLEDTEGRGYPHILCNGRRGHHARQNDE